MLGRGKGDLEAYRRREAECQGFHSPNPPGAGQTRRVAAGGDGHHHFLSRNQQIKPQLITFECSPRSGSGQYRVERPKWQSCQMLIAAIISQTNKHHHQTGNWEYRSSEIRMLQTACKLAEDPDAGLEIEGGWC